MPLLLATKIHPPPAPPKRVLRARLVERLNEGLESGRRMTLVSAPAGFGKTTCAREWVHVLDRPAAWLSLDAADDDPGRFFTYLLAALQTVEPAIGAAIEPILRSGQLPPADVLCATLINDIAPIEQPFLLVLDDAQVIQDAFILQVLENLVTNLPPPLHLVLLTREDPSLPLARLRANNQLTEIRADDLRFTEPEAGDFIHNVLGLTLSPDDLAALAERTEGWAAGLQLAGLSVRDRPDPSAFIARLSGSHRYILSYLTEEVLNRQSAAVQRFLLQTSILDRLSGGLCNAVTGREDGQAQLAELFNANLFLVPLDDEQHWFRYHHLFADLLRDLQAAQPNEETAELHQRASQWYARGGMVNEAIQHALAAEDYAAAVALIEDHAAELLAQWQVRTVEGWMQAVPPEWSARSVKANLAFAWMHLFRQDFKKAFAYIQRLQALFDSPDSAEQDPAVMAEWLALQAITTGKGNPVEGIRLANQALDIIPETDAFVRSEIYLALTSAYQQLEDYPRAVAAFQQIIQHDRSTGSLIPELVGTAGLTLMALHHGQYHFGFEVVSQGIERVERSGMLPPIATALYGSLGQIYFQWRQLDEAHRCFEQSRQLAVLSGLSDAELYHGVIRSRLLETQGNLDAAAAEIRRTVERMRIEAPAVVGEEVIAQLVRVELAQGRLAAAEAAFSLLPNEWGDTGFFTSQREFTLPDLPDRGRVNFPLFVLYNSGLRIALHRAKRAQTREDIALLARGIELAGSIIDTARRRGYLPITLETLLLRSQMHAANGNDAAHLDDVAAALELGEPEGLISSFVAEGTAVAAALRELLAHNRLNPAQADYARQVLAAFSAPARPSPAGKPSEELVEPLTERELDVLRLMAEGLKYEEITERLYISLNTVRTHVKSAYGKLGVNNRTKAVEKARQLGML